MSQFWYVQISNCVDAGMYQFWPRGVRYTCTKNRTALMPKCPSFGLGESGMLVQRIELRCCWNVPILAMGSQVYMYRVSNCVDAGMSQFWPRGVRYACTKNRTALLLECPNSGLGESGILVQRIELRCCWNVSILAMGSQVYMYKESNCVDAGMSQFWPRGVRYTCTEYRNALMLECPNSGLGESGILVQRIALR